MIQVSCNKGSAPISPSKSTVVAGSEIAADVKSNISGVALTVMPTFPVATATVITTQTPNFQLTASVTPITTLTGLAAGAAHVTSKTIKRVSAQSSDLSTICLASGDPGTSGVIFTTFAGQTYCGGAVISGNSNGETNLDTIGRHELFTATLNIPSGDIIQGGSIDFGADDIMTVSVNGNVVGTGSYCTTADIPASILLNGDNAFTFDVWDNCCPASSTNTLDLAYSICVNVIGAAPTPTPNATQIDTDTETATFTPTTSDTFTPTFTPTFTYTPTTRATFTFTPTPTFTVIPTPNLPECAKCYTDYNEKVKEIMNAEIKVWAAIAATCPLRCVGFGITPQTYATCVGICVGEASLDAAGIALSRIGVARIGLVTCRVNYNCP
jgi:hypothetical protein